MEVAAFVVGCFAIALSALSIGWQVFTWRRERRFAVRATITFEGASLGGGRYPIRVAASNQGGTHEWIASITVEAEYDRQLNRRMFFSSPELVLNPGRDRELKPRQVFESEFNLLSQMIGGGGLPTKVVGVVELASGRRVTSKPYLPSPKQAEKAMEPKSEFSEGDDYLDGYFPMGPHSVCPDCKSEIPSDARVCRYCQFRIADPPSRHSKGS
jgi:hypothetical protein